jgi:hypothetical protein
MLLLPVSMQPKMHSNMNKLYTLHHLILEGMYVQIAIAWKGYSYGLQLTIKQQLFSKMIPWS